MEPHTGAIKKKNLQNGWRRRYLLLAVTFWSNSFWAVKSLQLNVPPKDFNQHILLANSPLIYTAWSQSCCGKLSPYPSCESHVQHYLLQDKRTSRAARHFSLIPLCNRILIFPKDLSAFGYLLRNQCCKLNHSVFLSTFHRIRWTLLSALKTENLIAFRFTFDIRSCIWTEECSLRLRIQ